MKTFISIVLGDIVTQKVDAIVNAANTSLSGGGGVDGAIHAAAGPELVKASMKLAPCSTGEARITLGYKLPAKFVIHTVGPIYDVVKEQVPELLARCYRSCLDLAAEHKLTSIAFPSISTGVYGYPIRQAAPIAMGAVKQWIAENPESFTEIRFVLHSQQDYDVYDALGPRLV